jgi:Domain of unknown function (DUF4105)
MATDGLHHMSRASRFARLAVRIAIVAVLVGALILAVTAAVLAPMKPRNDRVWVPEHARMPLATFEGNRVRIENVRNFRHLSPGRFVAAYDDRTYDLDRLESVWFVLVPFGTTWRGPAHSFVTFGFRGDSTVPGGRARDYVAISIEARREPGETYGAVAGLLNHFEILYVVGDERDLIGQRAVINGDEVELYPIRTAPEKMRQMFVSMLERANRLRERPEFYNTLTSNCTSNLVDHVNAITPHKVPHGLKTILPGYADEVANAVGLIDTKLPLADARRRYRINDRARAAWGRDAFSAAIRAER